MNRPASFLLLLSALAVACGPAPVNNTITPMGDGAVTLDAVVDDTSAPIDGTVTPDGGTTRVSCTDDTPCTPLGQRCYRPLGYCVQCTADVECSGGMQVCTQGRCVDRVSCSTSRQCPGQVCDLARNACADCVVDPDCTGGSVCRLNNCVAPPTACSSDRMCAALDQVCNVAQGLCVDCNSDPDCPNGYCTPANTCLPRMCTPSATECLAVDRVRTCDARGTRWSESACTGATVCSEGRCVARVCAPDARSCADASNRRVCNADGLGYTATACAAGESCDRGDCLPRSCTPGASVCSDGTTRRVCNSDGLGFAVSPCPGGQGCVGGMCVPFVCTPGSSTCSDGTTRRLCAADGQSFTSAPCAAMQSCTGGVCTAWRCTPGASMCVTGGRSTCNADGLASTVTPCASSETCLVDRCVARTCSPSTYFCDAMGNRQLCSADGTTSTAASCTASQTCSAGMCALRGESCPGIDLVPDGPTATVIPTGFATTADVGTSCGSGSSRTGWTDVVFRLPLTIARDVTLVVNTGLANTRVQLQTTCATGQTAIGACLSGGNPTRRYRNLAAGTYFVVVEIYGTTGPIQIGVTTAPPNTRLPGDACPGVDVPVDTTATTISTAMFDTVSDVGTSCGSDASGASRDGYTDWIAHFSLATTRDVNISAVPSNGYTSRFELRSGCGAAGAPIGGCYALTSLNRRYRALPPGDYYLVGEVGGSAAPGNVPVTVTTSSPDMRATGDSCATAVPVTPDGAVAAVPSATFDNVSDVGTPCGSTRPRADGWYDVMWRFSLSAPRDVRFNFVNLPTTARWQVYQGCGATPVGTCSSTSGSAAAGWVRGLAAGDYYVVVESQYSFSFSPSLQLTTVAPGTRLRGDACSSAAEITMDGSTPVVSATGFDLGADVGTACSTTGSHAAYGDAVWHFRLAAPRDVTLAFSGAPSTFYWQLQRTCDTAGGVVAGCLASSYSGTRRYRDLPAGDYYVVAEWAGSITNSFSMTATSTAPTTRVAGDVCATAVTVTPDGSAASVAVDGLSLGGEYSTRCGSGVSSAGSYRDAVFSYTITATRDVTVTVNYASTASFEVWSACGDSTSALLSCASTSAGVGRITIPRQTAGTYYIVAQTTAATGPLAASVTTTAPGTTSGYTLSTSPPAVSYVNVCGTAGATSVLPGVDDDAVTARLPFDFRFWGAPILANSNVGISSNGFITLDGAAYPDTSGAIPDATVPNSVIAANWIDIVTGTTGVCIATQGTAPNRRWIVQWANARRYSGSGPINMEIILNESTNTIDLVYDVSMTSGGVVGVENATGSAAVTYPNTSSLVGARLRFTPN